jgi:hypothetical protein
VRAARALVAAALGGAFLAGDVACGTVRGAYDACEAADDCVLPYVCCTAPRIPAYGQKIPYCEQPTYCDAFLPFLVEDNPCHRVAGSPFQECSEGLECCVESLVCEKAGTCTGVVPTATAPSSMAGCVADGECSGGEVCCGIDVIYREGGKCTAIAECAPPVGP